MALKVKLFKVELQHSIWLSTLIERQLLSEESLTDSEYLSVWQLCWFGKTSLRAWHH